MELVYLWIKNYKNIEQIGCSLNANYNVMETQYNVDKDCLLINLVKQDYVNIFDNNLNIKTIIGANGSGKSNLCNALISILRGCHTRDVNDYFDKICPEKYFLLYKNNEKYECFTNCNEIEVRINNDLIQAEIKKANEWCASFKPFLNIEEDNLLIFPKEVHMQDIIKKKMENYFYYDRFRLYDTSHALRELFNKNKEQKFKILSDKNQYLTFDKYGYEINIVQEFEWITHQINNKLCLGIKKENTSFSSIWDLVDILKDSNNFIIDKAKRFEYKNINEVVHVVISNGCFEFVLIKIAEIFYSLEGQENIINLKNLDKILINLNEIDYKKKHIELKGFYEEILSKFNQKLEDEQIKSQLERSNLIDDFINLIQTCILFESKLIDNNNFLKNILITDDGNVYRPKPEKMIDVNINNLTKEMKTLNNLGIFKQNFYNFRNDKLYSFFDLSTGEQRILRFFADILSVKNNEKTKETAIFVFDEMDLSWHPEWQRKMVYYIIDFFKKTNINGINNIIFTTHSPFILSDMPQNNVLTLEKDNNGTVISHKPTINTFATNIHEMFKESFFMSSTIGEFAHNIIMNIINNEINEIKDKCSFEKMESKINLIGEPIIRKQLLKKLYDNKYIECCIEDEKKLCKQLMIENIMLKKEIKQLKEN